MDINLRVDRLWITGEYLPKLEGSILYIGVAGYTRNYHNNVPNISTFKTMDIDPTLSIYGSPNGHYTSDFMTHTHSYDHVSAYGIIGHSSFSNYAELTGVAALKSENAFLDYLSSIHLKLHEMVNPGGTLMLGNQVTGYCSQDYWRKIFKEDQIFAGYEILVDGVPGVDSNFIWWGRKAL